VRADTPEDGGTTQPSRQSAVNRGLNVLTVLLLLVALTLGVLYLIPANYYLLLPGTPVQVDTLISVKGHPAKAKQGALYLTDVSFVRADHLLIELYGKLNSGADLVTPQQFTGGVSESQYIKLNSNLMDQSIQDAEAAALNTIPGLHPHIANSGPEVAGVLAGTQAAKLLRSGDIIKAFDGHTIHRALQVRPLVHKLKPGAVAHLTILRNGKRVHIDVRTVRSNAQGLPDKHGKYPLIGILVQDRVIFPVKITIQHGDIVGPSAGLMFALGVIQHLSATDITHGCKIAGTGTIDFSGNVGAIGGVKQKIIGARNAGAKYFFVPDVPGNRNPAEQYRGNVIVVPVKTLHQALSYLKHIPPCSR
jgi:PDZ domain-containing protein